MALATVTDLAQAKPKPKPKPKPHGQGHAYGHQQQKTVRPVKPAAPRTGEALLALVLTGSFFSLLGLGLRRGVRRLSQ